MTCKHGIKDAVICPLCTMDSAEHDRAMAAQAEAEQAKESGESLASRTAAIDAAVAEAYERCSGICAGIAAGYAGEAHRLEGQHATHAAGRRDGGNECAAAIRAAAPTPRPGAQKEGRHGTP